MVTIVKDAEALRRLILIRLSEYFNCAEEDITGKSNQRNLHHARCVYSYLARHQIGDTFQRIGLTLNKDHSSVIRQVAYMHDLIAVKAPVAHIMKRIERELIIKQLI